MSEDTTPWHERIADEVRQAEEEGYDVTALRARVQVEKPGDEASYRNIADQVAACPRRPFPFEEPDSWEGMLDALEERPEAVSLPGDLEARLEAAWLGRCIGCMMGCPVEGWNTVRIRKALEAVGAYPLNDYYPEAAAEDRLHYGVPVRLYCREHLDRVRADDDVAYPVLGLVLLERAGPEFTAADVGRAWLDHLPRAFVFTAERVAYENLEKGLQPPDTARRGNPYREWIGAQIRADIWGWVAAGDPLRAAELACRDASLSHVRNGVYGAAFFAAAMARAFTTTDPREALDAGLRCIPPASRLARAITETMQWAEEDGHWEATLHRIVARHGRYSWVHVIPNALVTVMALIHGRGDFLATITCAVMAGFDTDCNAATAGSLAGILYGPDAIPRHLSAPLGGRVETYVKGHERQSIQDLARRTARVARRVRS